MIESTEDDLVTLSPRLGEVPREVVGELRGAPAVDDPAGGHVEQIGVGGTESLHSVLGVELGLSESAAIRQGLGERRRDGVGNRCRGLRSGRAVKEGEAGSERGEVCPEGSEIESHDP